VIQCGVWSCRAHRWVIQCGVWSCRAHRWVIQCGVWSCRAHRWVIPAESEITVKLCFSSDDCGQFDETLNFEIVGGAGRRHQLHCRGVCTFPTISREPRYTRHPRDAGLVGQAPARSSCRAMRRWTSGSSCQAPVWE